MKCVIAFVFCSNFFLSSSQVLEYFHLTPPTIVARESFYSTIHFVDSRTTTSNLGFVYSEKGLRKLLVVPERDFQEQFENLFLTYSDSSWGKGTLFVQFRKFEFIDIKRLGPDYSYCELRINLYGKADSSSFNKLATLDTLVTIDVINKELLFKTTSNTITSFIINNLSNTGEKNTAYTYSQILAIDSVEKADIKLYADSNYTDGVYTNFQAFKNQKPDFKIVNVISKMGRVERVIYKNQRGKPEGLEPRSCYAFVFKGKPYIVSINGYYPLTKNKNDFFFTGEFAFIPEPSAGDIAVRTLRNISETINPGGTRLYDMKLDHIDGRLIQIKEYK